MYKQNKKQIDEMFHILLWANDEIKKAIEKRQLESALDILEQCQDAAIQLGTSIEKSEGEGFVTVSYIEEFCEEIYQIHEAIMENGFGDAISTHKKISKSLSKIEQSIRNDIPVKKIAIFLPYKASMWDSLESVWKAADADPDCDRCRVFQAENALAGGSQPDLRTRPQGRQPDRDSHVLSA